MKLEKDTTISHYKILSEIGKGGMGEVYLAQDTELDRKVAVKFLNDEFSADADKLNRFVQEAKAASALNHPNIITIYEIGNVDDSRFIALEFIEGETLTARLKNKLKFNEALEIATQIASALDAAHVAGIVHRDIKPDNVMVRNDGLVKILDFGIAKLTEQPKPEIESEDKTAVQVKTTPGMIIGTANYMSPEQAKGEAIDPRTDIFSFGVVLYQMIAGHLPFEGKTPMEIIGAIIHKEHKPLNVSNVDPDLEQIITKTLRKDKNERYDSSKELLSDLRNLKKKIEFEAELKRTSSPDQTNEEKTQIINAVTDQNPSSPQTASRPNSIAVMPFEHLSSDEDNEYFCDGLAEELINALAKINRLEVAARSSSFSFKGKNMNVSEISERLNVKNVLEGSVRKAGNVLRISVQLINASDGYQVWSERYDREMEDIFDVQDEIALSVVTALKVELLGGEKESVLKRYTSNIEAYRLYLQGRFFFSKRTPEGFDKAIEHFQKAVSLDPDYALAYCGLADCHTFLGYYETAPPAEALERSKFYADKCLEIDDSIAETHTTIAAYNLFAWNFNEAITGFDTAINIDPKHSAAYHFKMGPLSNLNRCAEAFQSGKRAVELEPFTAIYRGVLTQSYYYDRNYDEAISQALTSIEIAPEHFYAYWVLGLAFCQKGRFDESISYLEKGIELSGGSQHLKAELARVRAENGEKDKAEQILRELQKLSVSTYISPVNFAKVYVGLGEDEKAIEQLELAYKEHSFRLSFFLVDPALQRLYSEPRIRDLFAKVGVDAKGFDDSQSTQEKPDAPTLLIAQDTAETGEKGESAPGQSTVSTEHGTISKWILGGVLGILLATAGFFGYWYFNSTSKQINSIAVMPFVNESGNEDVEYLSDGMTETLISSLTEIPNLSVKASSTVFYYKGKNKTPKEIGAELGVEAVLLGKLIQRNDDLTVRLELVDTRTLDAIWSQSYDRKMSDLVSLQSEIARNVSENLQLKLSAADEEKVTKTNTTNAEAQQFYLKGRFHWNKRKIADFEKAEEYFKQAIEKDPNYALAHSGLADTYTLIPQYGNFGPKDYLPRAKQAAQKALALDDDLAEAHTSLANILWTYEYDWANAEKGFKRAIELNPNYATAHQWYSGLLSALGEHDRAMKEIATALKLDPFSRVINRNFGFTLYAAKKYDEAIVQYKKSIELFPDDFWGHIYLGDTYAAKGNYDLAVAEFITSLKIDGKSSETINKYEDAYKNDGWKGFWLAQLNDQLAENAAKLEKDESAYIQNVEIARIYARIGNKDKAIEYLKTAIDEHESGILYIPNMHYYDPIRDDPRFVELMKQVGFPQIK